MLLAHVLLRAGAAAPVVGAASAGFMAMATAAVGVGGTLVGGVCVAVGASVGVAYCTNKLIDDLKGEFDLPTIIYTPYTIFSNKIPLFDVNFFNPMPAVNEDGESTVQIATMDAGFLEAMGPFAADLTSNEMYAFAMQCLKSDQVMWKTSKNYRAIAGVKSALDGLNDSNPETKIGIGDKEATIIKSGERYIATKESNTMMVTGKTDENLSSLALWVVHDQIFNETREDLEQAVQQAKEYGEVLVDFRNLSVADNYRACLIYKDGQFILEKTPLSTLLNTVTEYKSSSEILKNPVASVYKTLRIVAIVALLTILVYVGIRMVLASVAKDKIKYKNMLIDWFVALVLVFVLHYIMAFIIDISAKLTGVVEGSSIENILLQIPNGTKVQDADGNLDRLDKGDENSDFWATNYIGAIRFYAGLVQNKGYTVRGITYTLMYIVVVIYMVIFTWQYLKRVLYMAFLTMIAPLVAITYPIDKIRRWQSTRIFFVAKRIYI